MPEFRTQPLPREAVVAELAAACEALGRAGIVFAAVSFGWNSRLHVDEMWQDESVAPRDIPSVIAAAEASGVCVIGRSDVFIESPGFLLTLCHEGDVHVAGTSPLVQAAVDRWRAHGHAPYELLPSRA